ncbi:MAG: hypothetical protein ACPGNT_06345 [Rhodospirillales bacterium]
MCGARTRLRLWLAVLLIQGLSVTGAAAGPGEPAPVRHLVMFHSTTCEWCERWFAEIGPLYPKTAEGRCLPLTLVDHDRPHPPDYRHLQAIIYTPTFVVMENGAEIGRVVGYPGADFFWPLLERAMAKLSRPCDK